MEIQSLPLSVKDCMKSNILVSGTNGQGKSLWSMAICDYLMRNNFQIMVFDNSGVWKKKSSIPFYYQVKNGYFGFKIDEFLDMNLIFDISLLLPDYQKSFIEMVLNEVWLDRAENPNPKWLLIVCEESQLYLRNIRSLISQQFWRIASAGRNLGIRVLAITPSIVSVDSEFRRLSQQRYQFKLPNELNTIKRFNSLYGKQWVEKALNLKVGECLYYLNERIRKVKVPLFRSSIKPQNYQVSWYSFEREEEISLLQRIKKRILGE